ncbi:hypothetical protein QR97_09460 [Streptomyces sp. PBH53]|uniref:hypothetical protein n=1 Tax=Streptomyces TaxID=1883 RepID=UPI0006556FED|nr:hypothetical protein [Streptomyces sp. PBH53]AKN70029.1 hypothetical protein QR97_09460 [Streptomyces sp. PBH53]
MSTARITRTDQRQRPCRPTRAAAHARAALTVHVGADGGDDTARARREEAAQLLEAAREGEDAGQG